jgi:hypothetical protein
VYMNSVTHFCGV